MENIEKVPLKVDSSEETQVTIPEVNRGFKLAPHLSHPAGGVTGKIDGLQESKRSAWEIIKYLFSHVFGNQNPASKFTLVMAFAALISAKVCNIGIPLLFKDAVNKFGELVHLREHGYDNHTEGTGADPMAFADASGSTPSPENTMSKLGEAALWFILLYGIVRCSAEFLHESRNALFAKVAVNSIKKVQTDLFIKLHNLPLQWHLSKRTGAVVKAMDRGTRGANQILKATCFNIMPTLLELSLTYWIILTQCSLYQANVALATVAAYSVWTVKFTTYRTPFRKQMNKADGEAGNLAVDSLTNYETVKLFNNEKFESDRYSETLKDYSKANLKVEYSLAALNFGQQLIVTAGMTYLMFLSGMEIVNGNQTVGDLVLVQALLMQLARPLGFLGSTWRDMEQSLTDLRHMLYIMELDQLKDKKDAVDAKTVITGPKNDITFKNITFGYDHANQLFNNLNLDIEGGRKVAIVGGSGSGKSTLIRLLFRFYQPNEGSILINDKDISDMKMETLRQQIGVVPQDCVLFHDTIMHNIRYGNLEASEEEIIEAAKAADLHNSIIKMKDGYETVVGERGLKLSGGEKQRLAIARAMLKQPNIIVYDEATSSLDSITEQNILTALKNITKGKTTLVIAHRLSTVMDCDEIIVVGDKGNISQRGSHEELLMQDGKYKQLWESQHFA